MQRMEAEAMIWEERVTSWVSDRRSVAGQCSARDGVCGSKSLSQHMEPLPIPVLEGAYDPATSFRIDLTPLDLAR